MRRPRNNALRGSAHLLQLSHQVSFGVEAARGVHDHEIGVSRGSCLQRVEQHG